MFNRCQRRTVLRS